MADTDRMPFKEADMPKREKSFWRMTGPGAVLVGLSIGAGELVMWPWITARFGADMLWAAALGVFIQMWINIEIGRWAIATGESALTGFARASRIVIFGFLSLLLIMALLPGWARATGDSIKILLFGLDGPGPDWFWTMVVFALVGAVMFGPKRIYAAMEKLIMAMVILITLGLIFVAFNVGTWAAVGDMGRGLLNFPNITLTDDFTLMRFFGAVVFAGAGGFGNLYYAYYLRDKGIGMGGRVPVLTSALREKMGEEGHEIGYQYPETEENASRFRDWFTYVKIDNTMYFWLLNTFTMFLFMFGALVVLHPLGAVPAEDRLVWDLALILEDSMGIGGRYMFLIIGMAALFSTQLTLTDGAVRMWTDIIHTNIKSTLKYSASKLYLWLGLTLMGIGVFSTWFFETYDVSALDFLFLNAMVNGFAMAIYTPMILYINIKYLPKSARPHIINIIMVSIGAIFYITFALYTVWNKFAG